MRTAACLLVCVLPLAVAQEDEREPSWNEIEKYLADGLAAARKRSASAAVPWVKKALDALQRRVEGEWAQLLAIKPEGWTFFKPNLQSSTTEVNGETVSHVTGTMNGRRADGTIVIFFLSSSPAHLDSHRRLYGDPKRLAQMKQHMLIETEKRSGWLIAKRLERMRATAIFMGDHTVMTITLAKEDKALLQEMAGWLDLELAKRLDDAAGLARAK